MVLGLIGSLILGAWVAGCRPSQPLTGDPGSSSGGATDSDQMPPSQPSSGGESGGIVDFTVVQVEPAQLPGQGPPSQPPGQSQSGSRGYVDGPATVTASDSVILCGPFRSYHNLAFDPSGRFLSLTEWDAVAACSKLWLIDIPSQTATCPLVVPRSWIFLHGFGPGGNVYFSIGGRQTTGPYEGQLGWWVGAVSANADGPATVAFIPYERELPPPDEGDDQDNQPMLGVFISRDRTAILIQDEGGLPSANLRVALPGGEVTRQTVGKGPLVMYSSDGWWAICNRRSLVDVRADREIILEPPCEWVTEWSPDDSLVLGLQTVQADMGATQHGYVPEAGVGFSLYDRSGKLVYQLPAPGGSDRRIGNWAWSPDGRSLAFEVGTCIRLHFTLQELWVWTPATGALSKLLYIPEEAAEKRDKHHEMEWVDPNLIRLWDDGSWNSFGPVGWQDVVLRAGAESFSVVETHPHSMPDAARVGSRGADVIVVRQLNGVLHAEVLLVGPEGEQVIGQADARQPGGYYNLFVDAAGMMTRAGTLPYVVLTDGSWPEQGYLQLIALP